MSLYVTVNSTEELAPAADLLLKSTPQSRIFAFSGNMGAGKTTFIKALCKNLGAADNVSSPTFSLVNEYLAASGEKIFHFDFYRIKDISEAYDMGYEEYLYSGAWCFIEWPEKIAALIPEDAINVLIEVNGAIREISVEK
jgi:tRNA threonylcarbamoyladenosine biosynthesis protein TsaE